jgi:hypothetical protein
MNDSHVSPIPVAPVRSRGWLRVGLAVVIFISGFVIGGFTVATVIHNRVVESVHHPELVTSRIAARLRSVLDLSDGQTEEVTAIIEERRLAIQEIRREFQPRIEQELDKAQQQIAAILDARQQVAWEQHFQAMRDKWLPPLLPKKALTATAP